MTATLYAFVFFFQAEDGIRDVAVTGVQTCALPIYFGGTLAGRLVLSAGLGGMGGAQPLAVTLNEGVGLFVEVDRGRIERRLRLRYVDRMTASIDEALGWAEEARAKRTPLSIAVHGNAAEVHPELASRGVRFDVVTDQTSAHDMLNGYIPAGLSVEAAAELRARDARAPEARRDPLRLRQQRQTRGRERRRDRLRLPRLRACLHPPTLLRGPGTVPLGRALGCPRGHLRHRRRPHRRVPRQHAPGPLAPSRARAGSLPGVARPHLLAWLRRSGEGGTDLQRSGRVRAGEGPDRDRPRPPRLGLGRLAESRDGVDARRLGRDRRLADPQRPREHGGGGDVGLRPPRRRRRHRLLDPRGHGRRRRRQRGRGAPARARADDRPGHRYHAPRRRGLRGGDRRGPAPPPRPARDHGVRAPPRGWDTTPTPTPT